MTSERKDLIVGAIEAGGTKFVCAVGRAPDDVRRPQNRQEFSTGDNPARLIAQVIEWFREKQKEQPLSAIGIASFGPVDLVRGFPALWAHHVNAQTGLGEYRPGRADSTGSWRHSRWI